MLEIRLQKAKSDRIMKRVFYVLAAFALLFGYSACERQSWEETRKLHLDHGDGDGTDGEKKTH